VEGVVYHPAVEEGDPVDVAYDERIDFNKEIAEDFCLDTMETFFPFPLSRGPREPPLPFAEQVIPMLDLVFVYQAFLAKKCLRRNRDVLAFAVAALFSHRLMKIAWVKGNKVSGTFVRLFVSCSLVHEKNAMKHVAEIERQFDVSFERHRKRDRKGRPVVRTANVLNDVPDFDLVKVGYFCQEIMRSCYAVKENGAVSKIQS
jgi:hypothetical protein